jgi:hypothetical protein
LATDFGTGQPLERALRTCVLGVAIERALNVDEETFRDIQLFALLPFLGCTSDAADTVAKTPQIRWRRLQGTRGFSLPRWRQRPWAA